MRRFAVLAAAILATGLAALAPAPAEAQGYLAAPPAPAVFVFHGRRYCFAPDGWNGPGWYWCGFAYRRGFGFGGPPGWHGWRVEVVGHGPWRGPGGWRGGGHHAWYGGAPRRHAGPWRHHGPRRHGRPHHGRPHHGHHHHGRPHPGHHGRHR